MAARHELRVQLAAHPIGYPLLRAAARIGPVHRVSRRTVLVNDPALAREVISDSDRFTKTGRGSPGELWTPVLGPSVLLNMEGPGHLALRHKLAPLFTSGSASSLVENTAAPILQRMRAELAAGRSVDMVQVAQDLTRAGVAQLIGLDDPADQASLIAILEEIESVLGSIRLRRSGLSPDQLERARTVLSRLLVPAARAYHRGDDSIPGRMRQLGLDEAEAVGAVGAFLLVGTETVSSLLPRFAALVADSGVWEVLHDPTRRDALIAETLRFTTPTPVMLRSAAVDTTIGETVVRAGDRLVIATVSACRTVPGFQPDGAAASGLRQLWFGAGAHFCLGMPLAMAQARAFADALAVTSSARALTVVHRRVRHRVLIAGYRELVIGPDRTASTPA